MREVIKKTEEEIQLDRLYDTLTAYQTSRRPIELTDTEVELIKTALMTRVAAHEITRRLSDDGK